MPELPEVEVLLRHLSPLIRGKTIHSIEVRRERVIRPTGHRAFVHALRGARFSSVSRRGKFLLFSLQKGNQQKPLTLVGHLGMIGRMYLLKTEAALPRHCAVVLNLGKEKFVFEDTRYFGRLTLDRECISALGPEPLDDAFTPRVLEKALQRSRQPIKVKLLDQSVVAGVGNIYASEALFRAGISPRMPARKLSPGRVERLWLCIREVLREAIERGSTFSLNYSSKDRNDGLFYFGSAAPTEGSDQERFQVYDRAGEPCVRCRAVIKRLVQAGRSTFYCPGCQRTTSARSAEPQALGRRRKGASHATGSRERDGKTSMDLSPGPRTGTVHRVPRPRNLSNAMP
jgi:formamidopyrimidine-DNA glycosylase